MVSRGFVRLDVIETTNNYGVFATVPRNVKLGSCQFEQCSDVRFDAILKTMNFSNNGSMQAKMFSV